MPADDRKRSWLWPLFGAVVLAVYWVLIKPPGSTLGYSGDMCSDVLRQFMAEHFKAGEGILFHSDKVMAPAGASHPFMSWGLERDWLGAYFWRWNPEIPFLWLLAGFSWFVSYVGSSFFMRRMGVGWFASWGLALAAAVYHFPRHYKIWHHHEMIIQHWVYLAFFLDAWIWQRLYKEGRWSLMLEAWRGVFQAGVFMTAGYFWPITILEWLIVRLCLCVDIAIRRTFKKGMTVDGRDRKLLIPLAFGALLVAIEIPWFLALARELGKSVSVYSGYGWFADPLYIVRPLWLNVLARHWSAIHMADFRAFETIVSIGWGLAIPAILALILGGPGISAPFILLIAAAMLYMTGHFPDSIRQHLPFFSFFRTASRWGLVLPQLAVILIALGWGDLQSWLATLWQRHRRWVAAGAALFGIMTLAEASLLLDPINSLPAFPEDAKAMMQKIRELPGDTVLDLPFCVSGGNGYCTAEQCPHYPRSITGMCLRQWHEKKVYGLYQARMLPAQCQIYGIPPYTSWFAAWRENRCFSPPEWEQLCGYLGNHPETSALLVYPGMWTGAGTPECRRQFDEYLGAPLGETTIMTEPTPGSQGANPTSVLWYAPQCRGRIAR